MNPEELFRGESETIEYKASVAPKSEAYMKTVIAFANGRGGQLLFGVEDVSGEALGLGRKTVFKYMDAVANAIATKCEPRIHPHIYLYEIDRKPIIIVDVPPGAETPYWIQNEGIENGTYVRVGATTRKADRYRIEELILRGQHKFFDQELTDVVIKEKRAREFCAEMYDYVRARHPEDSEEQRKVGIGQLLSWGMLHEADHHFYASNGYLLMDGPNDRFTETGIQCAVFRGTRRGHIVTRSEYDGRFYDNIECAVNFISAHLMDRDSNGELYERSRLAALPKRSIREIVVNAVCHRSYQTPGKIQVSIFDDKIEVVSPGGLDCSLAVEDILGGRSRVRNPAIAGALRYAGMFEGWGNGIPQVLADAAANDLPAPVFRARPGDFLVRLSATEEQDEDLEQPSEALIPITDAVRIPVVALSEPSDDEVGFDIERPDEYEYIPYDVFGNAEQLAEYDSTLALSSPDMWQQDVALADEVAEALVSAGAKPSVGSRNTGDRKDAQAAPSASGTSARNPQRGRRRRSEISTGEQQEQNAAQPAASNAQQRQPDRGAQKQKGQPSSENRHAARKPASAAQENAQQPEHNGAGQKTPQQSPGRQLGQKQKPDNRQQAQSPQKQQKAGGDRQHGQINGRAQESQQSPEDRQQQGRAGQKEKQQSAGGPQRGLNEQKKRAQQPGDGRRQSRDQAERTNQQQTARPNQKANGRTAPGRQSTQHVPEEHELKTAPETQEGRAAASGHDVKPRSLDEAQGVQKHAAEQSAAAQDSPAEKAAPGEQSSGARKNRRSRRSRKRAQERAAELEAVLDAEPEQKEPAGRTQEKPQTAGAADALAKLTSSQRKVYDLLKGNPELTQTALSEQAALSVTGVRRAITALQEKKLLRREGGRRYGQWIAIDPS